MNGAWKEGNSERFRRYLGSRMAQNNWKTPE